MSAIRRPWGLFIGLTLFTIAALAMLVYANPFSLTQHTRDLILKGCAFAVSAYCFVALMLITLMGTKRNEWNALAIFFFGFFAAWAGYVIGLGGNFLKVFVPSEKYFDSWRTVILIAGLIGIPIVSVNVYRTAHNWLIWKRDAANEGKVSRFLRWIERWR